MKTKINLLFMVLTLAGTLGAQAQNPTFTYQGRLTATNGPVSGTADLTFRIFPAASGGAQIWQETTNGVPVTNGLFTVELGQTTPITPPVFDGSDYWLEIVVNGTTLTPRHKFTATPYAIHAREAATAVAAVTAAAVATDGVSTSSLQNDSVTSAKIADGSITAADVNSASFSNTFWKVDGNVGTSPGINFVGTTDNQALEFRANNARALRLEPTATSPNLIGGYAGNSVAPGMDAAVIAGGGRTNAENYAGAELTFIGGGWANTNSGGGAFLGGGYLNRIEAGAFDTVLAGGRENVIQSNTLRTIISGGYFNTISNGATYATIGGGQVNKAGAGEATVAGGAFNNALGFSSVIGGGGGNTVGGNWANIAGGRDNVIGANSDYSAILGGWANFINTNTIGGSIAGGLNNHIGDGGYYGTIGGGNYNSLNSQSSFGTIAGGIENTVEQKANWAAIGGGFGNVIQSNVTYGVIGGGLFNTIVTNATAASIGGGYYNTNSGDYGTVGGGFGNSSSGYGATVPGGYQNLAQGAFSFAAGVGAQATTSGTFVWADASGANFTSTAANQFLIRAAGGVGINTNAPGSALDVNGTITATSFSGDGAGLTGVNAGSLTGGPVPSTALGGTYSGAVTFNNAANSFFGNGSGLMSLNASQLTSGTVPAAALANAWKTSGNSGTTPGVNFLGTMDNQPLELKVNGQRALRLEPTGSGTANVIEGSSGNSVAAGVTAATIGGGDINSIQTNSDWGTIGGGTQNSIQAKSSAATIGGGVRNLIQTNSFYATISGGYQNSIQTNAPDATIGGGYQNTIQTNANNGTISGGANNFVLPNATCATIPGGYSNSAASYAFAAGSHARANHTGAFVWADAQDADFGSTGGNQFLIRASGGVGIGVTNPAYTADLSGRIRLRQDAGGTAGLWLYQTVPANDRSFIGMDGDGYVGLWGNLGANWGFIMNVTNGNVGIGTSNPTNKLHVLGGATFTSGTAGANQSVVWTPGSASWSFTSDRNTKDHITSVDGSQVLEKLVQVPLAEWNYRGYDQRHIGPMAQDFHAQFPLNSDDKSLNDADLHGVALAAIQGLNHKLDAKNAEIEQLKQSVAELRKLVQSIAEKR